MSNGETVFLRVFQFVSRLKYKLNRELETMANKLLARHFKATMGGRVAYQSLRYLQSEHTGRWQALTSASTRLTIVVVTYRQPEPLACLLASLRCQTLQNFSVLVLHDGADEATRRVVDSHRFATQTPCEYVETATRFNDYGHTLRDMGIQQATGEFILITNGDNYYSPRFVEFAFDAIDANGLDLVLWDIVHSHSNPGKNNNPSNTAFQSYPVTMKLDIGAFFVKTRIAQTVGFRDRTHDGDGTYFQDLVERSGLPLKMGKVEKVLMVHN